MSLLLTCGDFPSLVIDAASSGVQPRLNTRSSLGIFKTPAPDWTSWDNQFGGLKTTGFCQLCKKTAIVGQLGPQLVRHSSQSSFNTYI